MLFPRFRSEEAGLPAVFGGTLPGRSSKSKTPSSKLQNSLQANLLLARRSAVFRCQQGFFWHRLELEAWCFSGAWRLVLGVINMNPVPGSKPFGGDDSTGNSGEPTIASFAFALALAGDSLPP